MNFVKNFLFFLTLFTTRKIVVFFDVDNPDFSLNIDQLNIYFIDWLLGKITFVNKYKTRRMIGKLYYIIYIKNMKTQCCINCGLNINKMAKIWDILKDRIIFYRILEIFVSLSNTYLIELFV